MYKRYVKRGDKLVGPYWYESIRVDGQVKNIYLGRTRQEALESQKKLFSKSNATRKIRKPVRVKSREHCG